MSFIGVFQRLVDNLQSKMSFLLYNVPFQVFVNSVLIHVSDVSLSKELPKTEWMVKIKVDNPALSKVIYTFRYGSYSWKGQRLSSM